MKRDKQFIWMGPTHIRAVVASLPSAPAEVAHVKLCIGIEAKKKKRRKKTTKTKACNSNEHLTLSLFYSCHILATSHT